MYIEKLVAGFGIVSTTLLIWKAGSVQMLHFITICQGYAHACDTVATWSN